IPLVGPAAKSFRAMDSFISMSKLVKVQSASVKFNSSKVENVVQSMWNIENYLFGKLRLKTLGAEKYGNNKILKHIAFICIWKTWMRQIS
ncbi:hypothetical protein, partial [Bacillus manliponensis]